MTAPSAWLAARARSYHRDALGFAPFGAQNMGGLTGDQWAAVYRAVASELTKCAKELADTGPGSFCRHVEQDLFCVLFPGHNGAHECRGEFPGDW